MPKRKSPKLPHGQHLDTAIKALGQILSHPLAFGISADIALTLLMSQSDEKTYNLLRPLVTSIRGAYMVAAGASVVAPALSLVREVSK